MKRFFTFCCAILGMGAVSTGQNAPTNITADNDPDEILGEMNCESWWTTFSKDIPLYENYQTNVFINTTENGDESWFNFVIAWGEYGSECLRADAWGWGSGDITTVTSIDAYDFNDGSFVTTSKGQTVISVAQTKELELTVTIVYADGNYIIYTVTYDESTKDYVPTSFFLTGEECVYEIEQITFTEIDAGGSSLALWELISDHYDAEANAVFGSDVITLSYSDLETAGYNYIKVNATIDLSFGWGQWFAIYTYAGAATDWSEAIEYVNYDCGDSSEGEEIIEVAEILESAKTNGGSETEFYILFWGNTSSPAVYGSKYYITLPESTEDTGNDAITSVTTDVEVVEAGRYNLMGQKLSDETKGVNIVVYSDGSAKKVVVK